MTRIAAFALATVNCVTAAHQIDGWLIAANIIGAFALYLYAVEPICERGGAWLERIITWH